MYNGEKRVKFLNAFYDDLNLSEVLDVIRDHVDSGIPGYMVSMNMAILTLIEKRASFRNAITQADLILMDSQPLIWVANHLGLSVSEKLCGSDLIKPVANYAAKNGFSCFILGGAPGVPERASSNLRKEFPQLKICGTLSPEYGFEKDEKQLAQIREILTMANPDIVFVCLGNPKAEELSSALIQDCGIPFALCVGAAVDFVAGNVKRAPLWMRRRGLEWLYRFCHEPVRLFRRYFIESWRFIPIYLRYKKPGS